MTDAFVLGGVRTPVGRYGGSLAHLRENLQAESIALSREEMLAIDDITAPAAAH